MLSDQSSDSLAALLSDFLLNMSKVHRESPKDHPLLQIQAMQALVADPMRRRPVPDGRLEPVLAMEALSDYWERVFIPDTLSPGFRDHWRQYLVLAVAYFRPFRQHQAAPGGRPGKITYPQSYS